MNKLVLFSFPQSDMIYICSTLKEIKVFKEIRVLPVYIFADADIK